MQTRSTPKVPTSFTRMKVDTAAAAAQKNPLKFTATIDFEATHRKKVSGPERKKFLSQKISMKM